MAKVKQVERKQYMEVPPLSETKRKEVFPNKPMTLRELKATKNKSQNDKR